MKTFQRPQMLAQSLSAIILMCSTAAVNAEPVTRSVPARKIPVTEFVSPALQSLISVPSSEPGSLPTTNEGWQHWGQGLAEEAKQANQVLQKKLLKRYGVTALKQVIGGVDCFLLTPTDLPQAHRKRLLVHLHGGGYVAGAGEIGTLEGIMMAGHARTPVITIDYRMPPDSPYPAAVDDVLAVWKALLRSNDPGKMAMFGTSAGGGLLLSVVQRAKRERLPLPAAIAPGTPWSDLSRTGDSYYINAGIDPMQYEGALKVMAKLYAGKIDLQDPRVSPVYGDFKGFPPAILTSGTRDLFLSNTVRVNQKLREAGVETRLQVFEGQTHGAYFVLGFLANEETAETRTAFTEIARFFDAHLARELHSEPR